MDSHPDEIRLGSQLATRLYPVTLLIGVLIALGLPTTYLTLESLALRRTSTIYAHNLAARFDEFVLTAPDVWKYGAYKYREMLGTFLPAKDIATIRVLDEAGRPIIGFDHRSTAADKWWNHFAPVATAPIVFNNRTVGTVQVGVSHGKALGVTLGLLLFSMATGGAIAVLVYFYPVRVVRGMERHLERSNLELARRASEQHSLVEAARLLASTLDLGEVLGRLTEIARALLGLDVVRIWLRDEASGDVVLHSQAGVTSLAIPQRLRLGAGEGLTGWILTHAAPLALSDVESDPRVKNREWFHAEMITSFLGVPLLLGETAAGMLGCMSRGRHEWSEDEIRLAESLAVPAAIAIRNAQLYEEAKARLERMRTLTALSHLVTSSLDLQQVLDYVTESALDLLRGDLVRLWTLDETANTIQLAASKARAGEACADAGRTAYAFGQGTIGWVIEQRAKRYSPCLAEDVVEANTGRGDAREYISQIAVPLIAGERALGVLAVLTSQYRRFNREEEELLELFAATAATSLENARLFSEAGATAAALREKNAELDSFVYSVSHDLKAPLVTIQGMAGILVEDFGEVLQEQGRHYLVRIQANIHQMERLIADLLALSRIGREARAAELVSLAELVDGVLDEQVATIRNRGIKVVRTELPTVFAVRTQMEQVMANLLTNAIKYIGNGPTPAIEIAATESEDLIECWVKDNGIGIAPAYHDKVFEIFQRLKEVDAEGTGVGLAIVRKIVEGAGGRVWVESNVGEGATFRFTWPKAARRTNGV